MIHDCKRRDSLLDWLRNLKRKLRDMMERDVILIPVDARHRNFDGPKHMKLTGEVLGRCVTYHGRRAGLPWQPRDLGQGSYVINVPFSECRERLFEAIELLEDDGRRDLVFREVLDGEQV